MERKKEPQEGKNTTKKEKRLILDKKDIQGRLLARIKHK